MQKDQAKIIANKLEILTCSETGRCLGINIMEYKPTGNQIVDGDGNAKPQLKKTRSSISASDLPPEEFANKVAELISESGRDMALIVSQKAHAVEAAQEATEAQAKAEKRADDADAQAKNRLDQLNASQKNLADCQMKVDASQAQLTAGQKAAAKMAKALEIQAQEIQNLRILIANGTPEDLEKAKAAILKTTEKAAG